MYDVFVFDVVKVKVENVAASSMTEAIHLAHNAYCPYTLHNKEAVKHSGDHTGYVEYAEETSHYLVDPHATPEEVAQEDEDAYYETERRVRGETVKVYLDYENSRFCEEVPGGPCLFGSANETSFMWQYRAGISGALRALEIGDVATAEIELRNALEYTPLDPEHPEDDAQAALPLDSIAG
jgi:hypothetical protein